MPRALAGRREFLCAALFNQRQTGGILPSQRFLIGRMIAPVPSDYCGEILELGAGHGALTLRLATKCPQARVLACEINPKLALASQHNVARAGLGERVEVSCHSAEHFLSDHCHKRRRKADFVISGVPIGNFCSRSALALIHAVRDVLAPGGLYIQFQHFLADRTKIRHSFRSLRTIPVLLNLPPAVVYYAQR